MPKVECPNCHESVPVIPPKYLCNKCQYPLNPAEQINVSQGALIDPPAENKTDETIVEVHQTPSKETVISRHHHLAMETPIPVNFDPPVVTPPSPKPTPPKQEQVQDSGGSYTMILSKEPPPVNQPGEAVAGWLVVHTENKEPITYDLVLGDNFFGTEADGYLVEIPIKADKYVSRSHANIKVAKDMLKRFHYELWDDGARRPQGPSTNGTYINGHNARLGMDEVVFLVDGDTIQVGETKLVFKSIQEVSNEIEATKVVQEMDYTATVILPK